MKENSPIVLDLSLFTLDHPLVRAVVCRHAKKPTVMRDIEREVLYLTGNKEFATLCVERLRVQFDQMSRLL